MWRQPRRAMWRRVAADSWLQPSLRPLQPRRLLRCLRRASGARSRLALSLAGGFAAAAASTAYSSTAEAEQAAGERRAFESDYIMGEELGAGAFGTVFKATHKKTGKVYAVKVMRRRRSTEEIVRREVAMLQRVGLHIGVAELVDHFESDDNFYLVMELVTGGELFDALIDNGAFSEQQAADVIRQVADAAAFLHAQGLCHADIKPENLLLTERGPGGLIKLVDFGLATELRSPKRSKPGTWAYWPPEAFGDGSSCGKPTDMWAIGVVLFILLSGYHPFDPSGKADDAALQSCILKGEPDWDDPAWAHDSPEAKAAWSTRP